MKKYSIHFIGFLEFLILFLTLLIFILSSNQTTIFLINKLTTAYDLKYDNLKGNLLSHVTLNRVTYKDKVFAKEAKIDINFKSLAVGKFVIDDLTVKRLDLKVLEDFIKDHQTNNKRKLTYLPTITINSLFFSAKEYHQHDINIKSLKVVANEIKGNLNTLSIDSFSFYTENDYINVTSNGSLKDKIANLDHLWITDIDISKIEKFYKNIKKNNNSKNSKTSDGTLLNLVKQINIKNFKTDIKSYNYKKYKIKKLQLKASNLKTDLKSLTADADINAITNMWKLNLNGKVDNNKLIADAKVKLNDRYFKKFVPFFNFNKIKKLSTKLTLTKSGIKGKIFLKSGNLLEKNFKNIVLRIDKAIANTTFDFNKTKLKVDILGDITTHYSKNIKTISTLLYDKSKHFRYKGRLYVKDLINIDKNISTLLSNSTIDFRGNSKKIDANLSNQYLKAFYNSNDYKKGLLKVNIKNLLLKDYVTNIPTKLKDTTIYGEIISPIKIKEISKLNANFKLNSNIFNLNGTILNNHGLRIDAKAFNTKNSILKRYSKNLILKNIFPLGLKIKLKDKKLNINIANNKIQGNLQYLLNSSNLESNINIAGEKIKLKKQNDIYHIKTSTKSLKTLQEKAKNFIKFKKIPLDGEVKIDALLDKSNKLKLSVYSRWLVYEYIPNKFAFAEKIKLNIEKKRDNYYLKNYYFSTYLDRDRIFSSKNSSKLSLIKNRINLKKLWINDQAILSGDYDIKQESGKFNLIAHPYHYNDIEGDVKADISLNAKISKKDIDISGKVDILDGIIKYKTKKTHYVQDEDIIIIQDQKEKKTDKKNRNLTIDISIQSKKPIKYKIDNTDVEFNSDLKFYKSKKSDLQLLGMIKIIDGKHFEAKKEFKVEDGEILFAGNMLNPFLNIKVLHINDPYQIHIDINGLLDSPTINFNSTPFLTQSDIISMLLFDSTTKELFNNNTNSSNKAISLFGNTFAKEIVKNFGIKLDKLVLTTNQEGGLGVEVGKKISKKVTLIYINDIVSTIKVKYKHSKKFETDLTISPNSSGIDFLYKNDY